MKWRAPQLWTWLITGVLCWIATARGFQAPPVSVGQLSSAAEIVVHGKVLSKSCQKDATGRIFTKIELKVDEVWKGSITNDPFTIVHGGGVLGEQRVVVSGQVEYRVGEEVVAFVVLNERGEGVTVSLAQGKFTVFAGEAGQKIASPSFLRAPPPPRGHATSPARSDHGSLRLEDLKRQVQGATR
ncbi:MAG TPA: hypothetical protein VHH73_16675 [Verrucomicrobiae bacterium]|nr:hypothetical protein [Verrucomicrobiae bacterium]